MCTLSICTVAMMAVRPDIGLSEMAIPQIAQEAGLSLPSPTVEEPSVPAATASASASSELAAMFGGSVEELDDDLLAEQRGGFSINGLDIKLGVQIETFIDGQLSLVTTVSWTDTGATTTQTVSGLLTPASAAELQAGLLSTGQISMNVGDSSVYLANGGQTAVVHNTDNGLQSLMINTADNTSINTQVTATIDLNGYSAFRDDILAGTLGTSLSRAMEAAMLDTMMN
jgi:hypothetical protein